MAVWVFIDVLDLHRMSEGLSGCLVRILWAGPGLCLYGVFQGLRYWIPSGSGWPARDPPRPTSTRFMHADLIQGF